MIVSGCCWERAMSSRAPESPSMTNAINVPPWQPIDLPTLRAAYSDRTAALMAYFASFAYSRTIETTGEINVPQELSYLNFGRLTSFYCWVGAVAHRPGSAPLRSDRAFGT